MKEKIQVESFSGLQSNYREPKVQGGPEQRVPLRTHQLNVWKWKFKPEYLGSTVHSDIWK
jgi:hypothetical protein